MVAETEFHLRHAKLQSQAKPNITTSILSDKCIQFNSPYKCFRRKYNLLSAKKSTKSFCFQPATFMFATAIPHQLQSHTVAWMSATKTYGADALT